MREGFELPAAAAGVAGGAGTEGPLWVAGGSINDDEGGPGVKSRGAPSPMVDKPDPPPSHAIVSPWYLSIWTVRHDHIKLAQEG